MKFAYFFVFAIFSLSCAFVPTVYSAEEAPKKRSIWEYVFGTTETPSDDKAAAESENAENSVKKDAIKKKSAGFSEEERKVLENWQKGNAEWKKSKNKRLPPGLQKKVARGGELPPGWKKKLEVGSVLDPELEKEATSLPEEILKRLPKTPEGTEIIKIGDEVIRIFENSREIIDILNQASERSKD